MKKSLLLAATVLAFSGVMASAQNYDNGNAPRAKAQHMAKQERAPKTLYDYVPASQPVRTNQVYFYGVAY